MIPFPTQRLLYEALLRYDNAAFAHLYRLMYGRLAGCLKQWGGNPKEARELVHETIITLLFKLKNQQYTWRDEAELTTYVTAIAHNLWREQRRALQSPTDFLPDDADLPDANDDDSDDDLHFEFRRTAMQQALAQLGEKCRQSIQLYYLERLPMEKIATLLGWKNEAVARKEKSRCLQSLRAKLPPAP